MTVSTASGGLACRACGGALAGTARDLGPQPLCNRFLRSAEEPEERFPLSLGVCAACGLVQLREAAPAAALASRFDWITYQEAEGHLDALVAMLERRGAWRPGGTAAGTSYKDTTTLARLRARGAASTFEVGAAELDLPAGRVEIDALQGRLDEPRARAIAAGRPPADLLLARHVVEHAHDLPGFLRALRALVRPGGWVVLEVPDGTGMLARQDYSQVWEEHLVYFTPATLAGTLSRHGFAVAELVVYPYPFENAIVALARAGGAPLRTRASWIEQEVERAGAFFAAFPAWRDCHRTALSAARANGLGAVLLGAGHLSCTYLNLAGVAPMVACVLDDDPRRAGLRMPGSRLPIVSSAALADAAIGLCLLGVNPLSEPRVVERHQPFLDRGGSFRSIFPASPRALVSAEVRP